MPTFEAIGTPKPDFYYGGEHGEWLVTFGRSRDSDEIARSNWRFITGEILRDYPDDAVIESVSHWAVGWVEYLLIRPGSPAVKVMSDWNDVLDIYPIANDKDYEQLVAEEEVAE